LSDELDLSEFVTGFVAEAEEHLRTCRAALMMLDRAHEQGGVRPGAVRELYRALHTLKGLSAMLEVQPLVELAHQMESVLREAEAAGGVLSSEAVGVLVAALGAAEQRVREVARGEPVTAAPAAILRALGELRPSPAEAPAPISCIRLDPELAEKLTSSERAQILEGARAGRRAVRLTFVPSPMQASEGRTITSVREGASSVGELVRVLPVSVARSEEAPGGLAFVLLLLTDAVDDVLASATGVDASNVEPLVEAPEAPEAEPELEATAGGGGIIRVSVDRLERTLAQLGSIIVTRHRVERAVEALAAHGVDIRDLRHAMDEHGRRVGDLRESILQLRMVRVAEVLEPLPLMVRGLRATTGKAVHLDLDLARAELDKAVAEAIFPAIVQLVRNAVDHGIESPAERRRIGKPEMGRISICAIDPGTGMLELSVKDDGAGVDRETVARHAGVPVPEDDDALLAILVRPGLSARSAADHTSGRGMGLDIVHRRVQRLGGELRLVSRPGEGTTFVLHVPLTVTIVDGLTFTCGEQPFVAPLATIEEVLDLAELRMQAAPDPRATGATRVFRHHGEVISYMPLCEVFGLARGERARAVLVRRGGRCVAFGVDRVSSLSEVVVRPLEDPLVQVPGVAGSTDLGDGRATLVLDLPALASRIASAPGKRPRPPQAEAP
jgi:two-component system chemotaxis sensor kinase CheA